MKSKKVFWVIFHQTPLVHIFFLFFSYGLYIFNMVSDEKKKNLSHLLLSCWFPAMANPTSSSGSSPSACSLQLSQGSHRLFPCSCDFFQVLVDFLHVLVTFSMFSLTFYRFLSTFSMFSWLSPNSRRLSPGFRLLKFLTSQGSKIL